MRNDSSFDSDEQIVHRATDVARRFFAIMRLPLVLLSVEHNRHAVIIEAWTDHRAVRITRPLAVIRARIDRWGPLIIQLRDAWESARPGEVPSWA